MSAPKRLIKELAEYANNPNPVLASLGPVSDEDLLHWRAELLGPQGSMYQGCKYTIDIQIPDAYPLVPPTMTFTTPCCHPNVHIKTGEICLDLLRGSAWSPVYTISSALTAVSHLLTQPEPDSPLNVDVAAVMRNGDSVGYESLVRVWGVLFAGQ
ncbi:ubiquitin-conjugating enzyme/RWD-like protein, partial [Sphaerosporella brunnea]